jgi:hypothetical protein
LQKQFIERHLLASAVHIDVLTLLNRHIKQLPNSATTTRRNRHKLETPFGYHTMTNSSLKTC